ncbi:MAG: AraC family transcriptional regulator [Ignavibacteriaceae bacterium]|nr:AraC family transcriptional regulator [Ignavibacteriaceae bacterium]
MRVFIIIFLANLCLFPGIQSEKVDSLLKIWNSQKFPEAEEAAGQLVVQMYVADFESGLALSRRLLRESVQHQNKFLYINILIHSYRFHVFDTKSRMLNEAAELARSENLPELQAAAYTFKSIIFRDNSMPDSAMLYALMAKTILSDIQSNASLDEINQLIADMHFFAGEYNEAEKIYLQLMEQEKNFAKHWRFITLRSNLGLIKFRQNRLDEAERYFQTAFEKLTAPPMSASDSSGMVYHFRKLMEVNLAKGNYQKGEEYCEKGKYYAEKFKQYAELPGLYIGYAEILRHKSKFDSAKTVLSLAEQLEKEYSDIRYKEAINRERAYTFKAAGDYRQAVNYLEQWVAVSKTADSIFNRAKILHIYAEHNHQILQQRAEGLQREKNLIIGILFISIASFLILIAYYFRLRKSHKLLVEKNLELAYSAASVPIPVVERMAEEEEEEENADPVTVRTTDGAQGKKTIDETLLRELSAKLNHLIHEEKIYLVHDLTTANAAERLGTNRTYLSQAVHHGSGMTFPDLINGHRVREAIQIMNSDESRSLTIDSIAERSGFNNRVTFSKVFQKHTGVSPSFFMRDIWARNREAG